jgi:hypothetical protein
VIAQAHVAPIVVVPIAALLVLGCAWYWRALGRADVPPGRRRIRRHSMVLITVGIVLITLGLSVLDPATRPVPYVATWAGVLVIVLLVVITALLDALYTVGWHRRERTRQLVRTMSDATADRADGKEPSS